MTVPVDAVVLICCNTDLAKFLTCCEICGYCGSVFIVDQDLKDTAISVGVYIDSS